MAKTDEVGKWGEELAVELLVSKGYAITERNWKLNKLEIDIIAMRGTRIVFVEVKTRTSAEDDPLDAVDKKKISNVVNAAHFYIVSRNIVQEPQYDVITITGMPGNYHIEHIEDAFYAPLRTRY